MSSEVLNVELVAGTNFVGFGEKGTITVEGYGAGTEIYGNNPVELTRTVAAINMEGVCCRRHRMTEIRNIKMSVSQLDSVFVANVKSTAGIGTYGDVKTIEQSPLANGALDPTYYLAPVNFTSYVGTYKQEKPKAIIQCYGFWTGSDNRSSDGNECKHYNSRLEKHKCRRSLLCLSEPKR